jgi:murein DD-endopeptidase MepM/ murein hydrolase activator NlpD
MEMKYSLAMERLPRCAPKGCLLAACNQKRRFCVVQSKSSQVSGLRAEFGSLAVSSLVRVASIAAVVALLLWPWACTSAVFASAAEHYSSDTHPRSHDKDEVHQRLSEIELTRREMQAKVHEMRKKEHAAVQKLNNIKSQLNKTQTVINSSQHNLKKTEHRIQECENTITQTKSQEQLMAEEAGKRLREIYEGQRLGLIEMIFQVSSLPTLLDLFYYQERIAEMDRKLLDDLRQRSAALAAKKDQLGSQRNFLGDLISQFVQKAMQLNRQKDDQEAVAERLRTQRAFYEQAEQQLEIESHQLERQIVDMCANGDGKLLTKGSGTFAMPLHASITSPFGWRRHPIFGVRKFHTGVDIAGANHSVIRASDSGTVLVSGWYGGYGKVVIVSHGKGMSTLYAHLASAAVDQGQSVHKGDIIGYEGTTGFSTGPHLHFEVRVDGKPNNPLNYVH